MYKSNYTVYQHIEIVESTQIMHASLLASTTLLLWKALEDKGVDSKSLFHELGLDSEKLLDPNSRYPYSSVRKLWEQAIELSGDPCFSLTLAKYWHPSDFHALGYAWMASSTLKDALLRAARYFRIVTTDPEELILEETATDYQFIINTSNVQQRAMDEEYDLMATLIVDMCRQSVRGNMNPIKLQLQRQAPACEQTFIKFFRCPIEFDAKQNIIFFKKEDLELLLPTAIAELALQSDKIITDYLAHLNRHDMAVQVKTQIIEQLSSGHTTQESIAGALHVSLRSLQRRLQNEGTSYKQLLDETRKDLASKYIENSNMPLSEITFLLGFSEPANFTRAFKRWTGASPSEYRSASHIEEQYRN